MKELIEKLKDKTYVRAFGLMSPEEQECFKKVKQKNCLIFCTDCSWDETLDIEADYVNIYTYAIKPDYQPEPEFVDLEVVRHAEGTVEQTWWLGVWADKRAELPHAFTHLHCLPSLPNFECFWNKIPSPVDSENTFYCLGLVTKMRNAGHKVYARLRGQG